MPSCFPCIFLNVSAPARLHVLRTVRGAKETGTLNSYTYAQKKKIYKIRSMLRKPTCVSPKRSSHHTCTRPFSWHSSYNRVSDRGRSESGTIRCRACAHHSTFATWIDGHVRSAVSATFAWLSEVIGFVSECKTMVLEVANILQKQENSFLKFYS